MTSYTNIKEQTSNEHALDVIFGFSSVLNANGKGKAFNYVVKFILKKWGKLYLDAIADSFISLWVSRI